MSRIHRVDANLDVTLTNALRNRQHLIMRAQASKSNKNYREQRSTNLQVDAYSRITCTSIAPIATLVGQLAWYYATDTRCMVKQKT